MKGKTAGKIIALFAVAGMLAGCGGKTGTTPDDYATNDGYITTETAGTSCAGEAGNAALSAGRSLSPNPTGGNTARTAPDA